MKLCYVMMWLIKDMWYDNMMRLICDYTLISWYDDVDKWHVDITMLISDVFIWRYWYDDVLFNDVVFDDETI